jgi:Holliday junction resolvasome RuvABC endonuclease subunit
MKPRVIIGIDIGSVYGISVLVSGQIEYTETRKFKNLKTLFQHTKELFQTWKPDAVVSVAPVRFYQTLVKHSRMLGVLELCCNISECSYFEFHEASIKKTIIGTAKTQKGDVMAKFPECKTEHEADATMFARYLYLLAE